MKYILLLLLSFATANAVASSVTYTNRTDIPLKFEISNGKSIEAITVPPWSPTSVPLASVTAEKITVIVTAENNSKNVLATCSFNTIDYKGQQINFLLNLDHTCAIS
tara:strand:- start:32197 stop:32517 length:321 start_codon:yes stop_codon:yes gene_type:complete